MTTYTTMAASFVLLLTLCVVGSLRAAGIDADASSMVGAVGVGLSVLCLFA